MLVQRVEKSKLSKCLAPLVALTFLSFFKDLCSIDNPKTVDSCVSCDPFTILCKMFSKQFKTRCEQLRKWFSGACTRSCYKPTTYWIFVHFWEPVKCWKLFVICLKFNIMFSQKFGYQVFHVITTRYVSLWASPIVCVKFLQYYIEVIFFANN